MRLYTHNGKVISQDLRRPTVHFRNTIMHFETFGGALLTNLAKLLRSVDFLSQISIIVSRITVFCIIFYFYLIYMLMVEEKKINK